MLELGLNPRTGRKDDILTKVFPEELRIQVHLIDKYSKEVHVPQVTRRRPRGAGIKDAELMNRETMIRSVVQRYVTTRLSARSTYLPS